MQPLSLVLHPPLPLQEFFPSQECLFVASFLPICNATPGFTVETEAWVVAANDPLINPAIAAPAITAFFVMLTFLFWFLLVIAAALCHPKSIKVGNFVAH